MGIRKVNTSAYSPQNDNLIERFNRTLTDMLAKSVSPGVSEWDERLPYVLFSYRASVQASTGESPFLLLYGRDPQLPTETVLSPPVDRHLMELDDYKSTMIREMNSAWSRAQDSVVKAQMQQKRQYDKAARNADFSVGDRVFVCMPARKTGHMRKLACLFEGPYRVVAVYPNGVDVRLVAKPGAQPIHVALDRVRHCPKEIQELQEPDVETTDQASTDGCGISTRDALTSSSGSSNPPEAEKVLPEPEAKTTSSRTSAAAPSLDGGIWSDRLRLRAGCSKTIDTQGGEM